MAYPRLRPNLESYLVSSKSYQDLIKSDCLLELRLIKELRL